MKRIPRVFLFGALALVLLTAGCAAEEGTPVAGGTLQPGAQTSYPSPLETEGTETSAAVTTEPTSAPASTAEPTQQTPVVPVTGGDINVLECQFCIDTVAYALLDIPATATFEIVDPASPDPDTQCNTVDTFQDRQIVLCRAPEETSLTLHICTDSSTCSQVSVDLQACPVSTATAQPGVAKTKTPTPAATTATPEASPTAGVPTSTPTP